MSSVDTCFSQLHSNQHSPGLYVVSSSYPPPQTQHTENTTQESTTVTPQAIPFHPVCPANPSQKTRPTSLQVPPPQPRPPLLPTPMTLLVRRFTPAKLRAKLERELCYNCDAIWSLSHRCQSKYYLLLGTDGSEEESSLISPTESEPTEECPIGDISSLNTLTGFGKPQSLRFMGSCQNHEFSILIDNGSTHNFLRPHLAEDLQLSIKPIPPFRVFIGNGDYLSCQRLCPVVPLHLQGTIFEVDLQVLVIEGPGVVLGVQWLQFCKCWGMYPLTTPT